MLDNSIKLYTWYNEGQNSSNTFWVLRLAFNSFKVLKTYGGPHEEFQVVESSVSD
jgi:hypothetical protein